MKNKEKVVEVLALMDRSGSMSNIITEAVGSFNEFINQQKEINDNNVVLVTLAAFDDKYEVVFDKVLLEKLPELTVDMVKPRGMTALNDAIGKLINSSENSDRPTVLLIQTDGMENASQEYNSSDIKKLIEQKEEAGWDVNFIGAGMDSFEVERMALERGFKLDKTITVSKDASGMDSLRAFYATTVSDYRSEVWMC